MGRTTGETLGPPPPTLGLVKRAVVTAGVGWVIVAVTNVEEATKRKKLLVNVLIHIHHNGCYGQIYLDLKM